MKFLILCFLIINAAGFLVMTADKLFARKKMWRVPEATLLSLAAVGGSLGVLAAMYTVRHKTKHMKFVIGVPLIIACQIGILLYFLLR